MNFFEKIQAKKRLGLLAKQQVNLFVADNRVDIQNALDKLEAYDNHNAQSSTEVYE